MASSEDFQGVYELYKRQGVPKGISIVQFCQHNGIVYSQFERWFKSRKQPVGPSFHPIRQSNLNYHQLFHLVEKLEAIC